MGEGEAGDVGRTGAPRVVRLRRAQREGVSAVPVRLDALIGPEHLARRVWQVVQGLDLAGFLAPRKVFAGGPGHPAADPAVLVALWVYGTSQGVTHARELDRLCVEHLAYIWLCGGVRMNYHTLSDFRVQHGAALDGLFTQVLGQLAHGGVVDLSEVAQDGMRVRASAGAASYRRQPTLEANLAQARALLATIHAAAERDASDDQEGPGRPPTPRRRSARQRAARERVARLEAALAGMPAARKAKGAKEADQARVSTTDAEARVMKLADGGFRPAYNVQFATTTADHCIVGVEVSTQGTDAGLALPMVAQVAARTGQPPGTWAMDGGFVTLATITQVETQQIIVLAPPRVARNPKNRDRAKPQPTDPPGVAQWRARMATPEAKAAYKHRAATAELVNAQARGRHGVTQFAVRGLAKVRCLALWTALTHNLLTGLHALLDQGRPCATPTC